MLTSAESKYTCEDLNGSCFGTICLSLRVNSCALVQICLCLTDGEITSSVCPHTKWIPGPDDSERPTTSKRTWRDNRNRWRDHFLDVLRPHTKWIPGPDLTIQKDQLTWRDNRNRWRDHFLDGLRPHTKWIPGPDWRFRKTSYTLCYVMLWRTLIGAIPGKRSPWLKAPRTGATRTFTWIARIHSHTNVNTVTTMWCEAPAQLFVFSACWVFSCFSNPPNSDMDCRIFIVRRWSFSCVRVHT